MREGRGWSALLCIAANVAAQQIMGRVQARRSQTRTGVNVMTSYLILYMTNGGKLFGANVRGLNLSRFGLLPHEIAALNAR
jgi:hypothetical protein